MREGGQRRGFGKGRKFLAQLQGVRQRARGTLLILKMGTHSRSGATFLLRTCGRVFCSLLACEIASNFKNANSGVSHSVLLRLSNQSDSLIQSPVMLTPRNFPGTHGPAPPLAKQRKGKPSIFTLSFSTFVTRINAILQVGYSLSTGQDELF